MAVVVLNTSFAIGQLFLASEINGAEFTGTVLIQDTRFAIGLGFVEETVDRFLVEQKKK